MKEASCLIGHVDRGGIYDESEGFRVDSVEVTTRGRDAGMSAATMMKAAPIRAQTASLGETENEVTVPLPTYTSAGLLPSLYDKVP